MPEAGQATTFKVILTLTRKMLGDGGAMRWRMSLGIALELVGVALGILGPYFLKTLIDGFAANVPVGGILMLVGLFVLSWSGGSVLSTIRSVYSTQVIDQIAGDMAISTLRGKLPDFAKTKTSETGGTLGLLERLPYSLSIIVDGLIWRSLPIALQLLGSLWLVCVLIPPHYALILAFVLAGYVLTTWLAARRHRRRSADANLAIGAVSRELGDVLRNARRVVFNGTIDLETARVTDLFSAKARANTRMMWSLVGMVGWQYGVVGMGFIVLLSLGTSDVLAHRMTVGDFVLLQAYALRLAAPLAGIGFVISQSAVAIANIREVLELPGPPTRTVAVTSHDEKASRVSIRNVTFGYSPDQNVLSDVSIDIEQGSFTVIIGPNGSGKSTLAQLMAGILEPQRGTVSIDGRDLSAIPSAERHRQVLYVPQFIGLFNRSLASNGLYPPTTLTQIELAALLNRWRFHEGDRPINLDIGVGEQGERMSGGQIQKLELARLTGIARPVLILDESTSALDPASEALVVLDLRRRIGEGMTLVMVSHHVQLARQADRIIFLSAGRIAADGRHEELLMSSPDYRSHWKAD